MIVAVISTAFVVIIQAILLVILHGRLAKVEELLQDVSLDITLYNQMKIKARELTAKKPVDKVGTWKK